MKDVAVWIQSGKKDFCWSSRPESRKEIVIESVTGIGLSGLSRDEMQIIFQQIIFKEILTIVL